MTNGASEPADVAAMRAELDRLRAENATLAEGRRRRFNGRAVGSVVLMVIAALLLPIAVVGYWGQRTLVDTEQYINTVAPLSQDPTIRTAVGQLISEQLQAQVDLEPRVEALLPDQLKPLAGPIAGGVHSFIDQQIQNFLASDAFSQLWVEVNRRAQQSLISALEGQPSGAVSIQGSEVVLDTGVIADQVKARLVARGLTVLENVPVPPQADRQIVLLDSPQLQEVRRIYSLAQPVAQWLIYVVAAMLLGAVLLARRRARAVLVVGVVVAAEAVLLRLLLTVGEASFQTQLAGTPFEQSANVFYTTLTSYLALAIRTMFVLGLVLLFAGWFAGGSPSSAATRRWLSGVLGGAGSRTSSGPLGKVGGWVAPRRGWLRAIVVLVAAVIVLLQDRVTGELLVWTLVGVLLALALIEFLVGAAPSASEPAEPEPVGSSADGRRESASVGSSTRRDPPG